MLRRLSVLLAVPVLALMGTAASASAAPINTVTVEHGLVENFVDVLPICQDDAPLYNVTTTTNLVDKLNVNPDNGTLHGTFTQTGSVVATPLNDPSLPSYTGHVTIWGGFNQNTQAAAGTFTFSVQLKGSDGSRISTQQVEHFNERPDGSVHEFFKCQ